MFCVCRGWRSLAHISIQEDKTILSLCSHLDYWITSVRLRRTWQRSRINRWQRSREGIEGLEPGAVTPSCPPNVLYPISSPPVWGELVIPRPAGRSYPSSRSWKRDGPTNSSAIHIFCFMKNTISWKPENLKSSLKIIVANKKKITE